MSKKKEGELNPFAKSSKYEELEDTFKGIIPFLIMSGVSFMLLYNMERMLPYIDYVGEILVLDARSIFFGYCVISPLLALIAFRY